jgi:hypothetical protein
VLAIWVGTSLQEPQKTAMIMGPHCPKKRGCALIARRIDIDAIVHQSVDLSAIAYASRIG